MPITVIAEFPKVKGRDPRQEYDALTREMNDGRPMTQLSDWGDGLLSHSYSVDENGDSVAIDVWEHQRGMDAFMQRLQPILEREGMTPRVRVLATHNVVTGARSAAPA
jgi:hypothetical protein